MTVTKGFLIILLSGLVAAAAGGALCYSFALVAPAYYRAVFPGGREPDFDPVAVGLGVGISQGLIVGLLIGAVVVLAVAWYKSRRGRARGYWGPGADLPDDQALSLPAPTSGSTKDSSEAIYRPSRPDH